LEVIVKLETQFDLVGQRVYRVGRQSRSESVTCPACEGRGRLTVVGADGAELEARCPQEKCGGRGSWTTTWYDRYEVFGEALIGRIEVKVYDPSLAPSYAREQREENYMLDVTGIGSGTVYPLRDGLWSHTRLFASLGEAESFCDAENPKLRIETERVAA
jgi:hypothetical protein